MNNATYGFRVLAGCRAFLLPHQISTVARCFETTSVRYMLADEVGLGKTVEACSILSILASEKKNLRVLIIVPGTLVSQWENELHYKFGIDAAVASPYANICLLPMEDIDKSLPILSAPWELSIVDETHRLLAKDSWYGKVQNLSRKVTHILLLSATPIQDRNEEYRRLLALLNPEQYEDMPADQFSLMVKRQKRVQKSANLLLGYLERYDEDILATTYTEKFKYNETVLAQDFIVWLSAKMPEVEIRSKLPLALSAGLRTLHEVGLIRLETWSDSTPIMLYHVDGDPINSFTHISVKEEISS